jgi:DedD protein
VTEQNRYRLTGAIFLIAVAVIVLPMLFDGKGLESTTVPEPPANTLETEPTPEMDPLPDETFARSQELRESVDADGFAKDTSTRVGQPVLTEVEPVAAESDDSPGTLTRAPESSASAGTAFGIQLGSFAERTKAVALRDRARNDGYPVFLSEAKQKDQVVTRVAVGPYVDRKEAERLRDELSARYALKAMVVGFSS